MTDPRIEKLADMLINYACAEARREHSARGDRRAACVHQGSRRRVAAAGGRPLVLLKSNEVNRSLMLAGTQRAVGR